MKHSGTKIIETERLLLRPFRESDMEAAYRNWTSDDKVTEFLRWPTHPELAVTRQVVSAWVEQYRQPDFYHWAIVLKDIDEPIGSISVVNQDEKTKKVHIGYCIGSKWWHQGITAEAFQGITPFLFNEVGVNRIESQHDPNNPNSGKVMEKCGLKYEGTLRQADYGNQGIVDAAVYSLLKSEWRSEE